MPPRAATLLLAGCAALIAGSGCGGPAPDSPLVVAPPELPVATVPPQPPAPQPPAGQPAPKPADAPPARNDLAERAVRKALMPDVPAGALPPAVNAPRPRVSEWDRGELPLPKFTGQLPPSPQPTARPTFPAPPVERPPVTLGSASAVEVNAFPAADRPRVKAARPADPTAADVPAMARQLPDRASVEDPTADLSAKGVIATPLPLPSFALPYLKAVIPDPFEFAEQLKGKLGKETEFGTAPVVVPPQKR